MKISNENKLQEIITLYKKGLLVESLNKALKLKKIDPSNPDLLNALGIIYRSLKKSNSAIAEYKKLIIQQPNNATFLNNMGNALRDSGKLIEATKKYRRAVKIKPMNVTYRCNLAKVYNERKLFLKGEKAALAAKKLSPQNPEVLNNLALALEGQKEFERALVIYKDAYAIDPENFVLNNNLGNIFFRLSKFENAIWHLNKAVKIKPDNVTAYNNLCEIYEKTNDIFNFNKAVNKALIVTKNHPEIRLKKGQLEFRKKHFRKAIVSLKELPENELPLNRRPILYETLGKSLDLSGSYDEAFFYFKKMNLILTNIISKSTINGTRYLALVKKLRKNFDKNCRDCNIQRISKNRSSPVFMVGFPRSGTTLLDTILRTHSKIEVIEEQPIIDHLNFLLGGFATQKKLDQLSKRQIRSLEETYFDKMSELLPNRKLEHIVIDKFPLNIIHVPLIQKIFPDAKFIRVLRHPYDCVLSCFMQNFQLNDAMANFLDIKMAATLYNEVMTLWSIYSKNLNLNVKTLRYEDLVSNFKKTVNEILVFLELDWEDSINDFNKTGKSRERINTPSYSQVTQKLYTNSKYRWKNYKSCEIDDLLILNHWNEKFFYDFMLPDN